MIIIYLIVAFLATTIGSMTGMGGGVIIKPVMDLISDYPVETVGIISSITVFSMAVVSAVKYALKGQRMKLRIILPVAVGSAVGGMVGQLGIELLDGIWNIQLVKMIQNILLVIVLVIVFLYMKYKPRYRGPDSDNLIISTLLGFSLGMLSSFIGIGGGPINVVAFTYLYGVDIKKASIASLVSIVFSQFTKLTQVGLTMGFAQYDLSIVPYMVIMAIIGAQVGSVLTRRLTGNMVETAFVWTQFAIMAMAVMNIVTGLF